jgi:hypothetical protein
MDGDFIDSGQDTCCHVSGDPELDLLLELEWGNHGGSCPGGGASAQASIQSRGTYRVLSIIGGGSTGSCSIIPMGNYFDDTTQLLLEEDPPDLVQSFLRAITSMTLLGALVGWVWLGRLFAQRVNMETKDHTTIVCITWLPQLPFQSSLVQQSIFVPRTWTASYPTNIRTFNPSMWES